MQPLRVISGLLRCFKKRTNRWLHLGLPVAQQVGGVFASTPRAGQDHRLLNALALQPLPRARRLLLALPVQIALRAAIVQAVKVLENEHASYVDEFVTRGNQALYAVLSKIYALAVQINHSDNKDSILKNLRNVMSLQKKIKTQKNSSALTLLVRWVVGGSRQLAHTYSKALEAAYKDNIAADELAAYFTKQGGLNGASKRNSEQKEVVSTVRETEFNQFMRTADICSKSFENTKIKWTEEVFMDNTTGHAMILGNHSGGGDIHGYRAFNLSNDAFKKISKILADEMFKAKREDEISAWVKKEHDNAYSKVRELAQGAISV